MIPLNFYWSFSSSGVEPENGLFRKSNSSVKIIFRLGMNFTCLRNDPVVCFNRIRKSFSRRGYKCIGSIGGSRGGAPGARPPPHLPGILVLMIFWDILYKIIFL